MFVLGSGGTTAPSRLPLILPPPSGPPSHAAPASWPGIPRAPPGLIVPALPPHRPDSVSSQPGSGDLVINIQQVVISQSHTGYTFTLCFIHWDNLCVDIRA